MPGLRWGLMGGMRYRVLRVRARGLPSLALSIPHCAILAKALPSPRPQLACHRQGSRLEDGMKNTQKMDNTVPDMQQALHAGRWSFASTRVSIRISTDALGPMSVTTCAPHPSASHLRSCSGRSRTRHTEGPLLQGKTVVASCRMNVGELGPACRRLP